MKNTINSHNDIYIKSLEQYCSRLKNQYKNIFLHNEIIIIYIYLLLSRLYCWPRSQTESAFYLKLAGYTASRELHPALKIIILNYIYIIS